MANDEQQAAEPTEPSEPPPPELGDDEGIVPDIIKRAIHTGFKTVNWGQESARAIASGILNNEKVEAVGSTLNTVRSELVGVVGRELVRYLDQLNLTDEAVKVLTAISLELKTEIRFIPNDKKLVTPDVKAEVTVKRTVKKKKPAAKKRRSRSKKKAPPAE